MQRIHQRIIYRLKIRKVRIKQRRIRIKSWLCLRTSWGALSKGRALIWILSRIIRSLKNLLLIVVGHRRPCPFHMWSSPWNLRRQRLRARSSGTSCRAASITPSSPSTRIIHLRHRSYMLMSILRASMSLSKATSTLLKESSPFYNIIWFIRA